MVKQISIDELRKVIALSDQSDELLHWIIEHGEYQEYPDGSILVKSGEPTDLMMITLQGQTDFYMNVNGRLVYYYTFGNTVETGGIGGLLPYSRMKTSVGNAYTKGDSKIISIHRSHFPEMERLFPDFIQKCIGYMTERARFFATNSLQHEKVNALGKLSAGIAHELNNPASAIDRIASELKERLDDNYSLTEKLFLNAVQPEALKQMMELATNKTGTKRNKLSSIERMDIEDEITDWLSQCGLSDGRKAAETFTEAGFSISDFELIKMKVETKAFVQIINWLENLLSSERLMKDLAEASDRISKLVTAIKSHVHMDRNNDIQCCTNIHNDIENTITLLGYKLREKNIKIHRNFKDNLPEVEAYIGELNQVWTNLIDNAIFALEKDGELQIETSEKEGLVTIKLSDNGSGIPKDIISRIFDPFFTTKKVGQGTGIGLDLVKRIIHRHNGEIKVRSEPGNTEFIITLPVRQKKTESSTIATI